MISFKKYYLLIPAGIPTQGDIWTNLPFPAFDIDFKIGLLITPKCDFAHEKTKVFNYVPALDFDEYLTHFGYSRILSEEFNRQKNALKGLNLQLPSFSLLEIGVSEAAVLDRMKKELSDRTGSDKKNKKQFDKFEEIVSNITRIKRLMAGYKIDKNDASHLIRSKDIAKHREMVIRNQVVDLHFLPSYPPLIYKPLVLLLRYICTCQIELLNAAHNSVNDDDWKMQCLKFEEQVNIFKLCPEKPDRILRLKSPYLENLMNRIALLYMRIGVPDFAKSEYKSFLEGDLS